MIGIDVVEINRIKNLIAKENFLQGVFAAEEYQYYIKRSKNVAVLAGIYAAKEAYLKAIGTGIDCKLSSIEISHTDKGQPYYVKTKDNQKYKEISLSITHTNDIAIAVCCII